MNELKTSRFYAWVLLTLSALLHLGCQIRFASDESKNTTEISCYGDDVQYFPASPTHKLDKESSVESNHTPQGNYYEGDVQYYPATPTHKLDAKSSIEIPPKANTP